MAGRPGHREVAQRLAALYDVAFGGKERGRYRFSMKQMRALTGRKRVPPNVIRRISEEIFELGYVLIDLETFFVVLAQPTFRSYRRLSDGCLSANWISVGGNDADQRAPARARV